MRRVKAELDARAWRELDEVAFGLPQARLEAARGRSAEGDTATADAIFAEVEDMESAADRPRRDGGVRARQAGGGRHPLGRRGGALRYRRAPRAKLRSCLQGPRIRLANGRLRRRAASGRRPDRNCRRRAWRRRHRARHRPQRARADADGHGALRGGRAALPRGAGDRREDAWARRIRLRGAPQQPRGAARATGRFEEAEPLYREALAIAKDAGKVASDYAHSSTTSRSCSGPRAASRRPSRSTGEALAIAEKTLGKAHPVYATDLNNLALLLRPRAATRRPSRSTARRWRSREGAGQGASRLCAGLNNLAVLLEAKAATRRPSRSTARRWRSREGAGQGASRLRASSLNNLAELLRATGRTRRPSRSTARRWRSARRRWARRTPTTRQPQQPRGAVEATGRYAEAEPLYREALAILTVKLGSEHPSTKTVAGNLEALGFAAVSGPAPD